MAASRPKKQAEQAAKSSSRKQQKDKTSNKSASKSKTKPSTILTDAQILARVKGNADILKRWAQEAEEQEARRTRGKNGRPRASTPTVEAEQDDDEEGEEDEEENEDHRRTPASEDEYQRSSEDEDGDGSGSNTDGGSEVAAKKRRGKRARSDSQSEAETPVPKKRKRTGANVPMVTVTESTPLLRALPKPRGSGTDAHQPVQASSSDQPSTPNRRATSPTQQAAVAQQAQAAATSSGNTVEPVCTPYTRRPNPSRKHETLESLLSPVTKSIFEKVKPKFLVFILTQNGFATFADTIAFIKPEIEAASKDGVAKDKKRFLRVNDDTFVRDIAKLAFNRASALRNHLLEVAKRVVDEHYKVKACETAKARRTLVKNLLRKHAFIYEDPKKLSSGIFEHRALQDLIVQGIFLSSKPAYNLGRDQSQTSNFDPFPMRLLALSAVTLQCVLEQWKTGKETTIAFSADAYRDKYNKLFEKLSEFLGDDEEVISSFAEDRAQWYRAAMESCGAYDSDDTEQSDDEDDEELMLQNQAAFKAAKRAQAAEKAAAAAARVAAGATAAGATAAGAAAAAAGGIGAANAG